MSDAEVVFCESVGAAGKAVSNIDAAIVAEGEQCIVFLNTAKIGKERGAAVIKELGSKVVRTGEATTITAVKVALSSDLALLTVKDLLTKVKAGNA